MIYINSFIINYTERDELALVAGDLVVILKVEEDGWSQGFIEHSPDRIGLFPSNYVRESQNTPPSHLPSPFQTSGSRRKNSSSSQQKQRAPEDEAKSPKENNTNVHDHHARDHTRTTGTSSLRYARALFDYTPQGTL
jgi:hypothetical protein